MGTTSLPTNFQKHTTSDPSRKFFIKRFNNTLIRTLKSIEFNSVLDAGCGEGFTLNALSQGMSGKKLQGVDFSKEAIELGKKQFPKLKLMVGDIYKLPYEDNSFDLVICSEVLEHLENPIKALNELRRVSKKYLVLSVPNEPFFMLGRLVRGLNMLQFGNHPEHINHWSAFSFPQTLQENKIKVIKKKYPFPWQLMLAKK